MADSETAGKEPTIDDSVLAGICSALGHKVIPINDHGRVVFSLNGDAKAALQAVNGNQLVGALDVFQHIKRLRQEMYLVKTTGACGAGR